MDSEQDSQHTEIGEKTGGARPGQSRRQFSRSAAVGGAVLLTLGNRAAWGGGGHYGKDRDGDKTCISKAAWNSLQHASYAPSDKQKEEARQFQEYAQKTHQFPEESRDGQSVCVRNKDKDKDWDNDKDWGNDHGGYGGRGDKDRRNDWGSGWGGRD